MRFLHTSDWHLGRSFHGAGMLDAQAAFIDELVATVRERRIDVVLIAGDVYDRALPGVDVVRLFDDALVRLRAAGAEVVLSSGNHDSATRLGFGGRLLGSAGIHVRTRLEELDRPVEFDAGDHRVAVYALPYLEPRMTADALGVEAPGHGPVVAAAVGRIRDDVEARGAGTLPLRTIVMAHVFAAGGSGSDSERELSVGGLEIVPVDVFEGFDYLALGHLHGRQTLRPGVRYSGSPLPYSFSEAAHVKGSFIVETSADGIDVEEVEWSRPRPLAVLRGRLEELLADEALAWAEPAYCQVTLTDADRPAQAMQRLRERFPETLVLAFEPEGRREERGRSYGERIAAAASTLEVCSGFVDHVRQRPPSELETEVLAAALADAASREVSA
ncbi:exonuclease SbcCD subunit D [Zafaria sp. J156]|uniref:exonuclease SbcCD subunit D n=1 Tax=Zafaria sp. J156 TaxID=3116490 RepID=UPI002E77216A|nr:exonuclease SbcCD subunit D [Zafaria sp. J156]MEE1620817.1 exonuclease SbcCD subunit D [Zafaria sp. J156]